MRRRATRQGQASGTLDDFILLRYETEHTGLMLHCENDLHDRLRGRIVQCSNPAFLDCCFLGRFLPKLGGASRRRLLFANWMSSSSLRPSGSALRVARHHPSFKSLWSNTGTSCLPLWDACTANAAWASPYARQAKLSLAPRLPLRPGTSRFVPARYSGSSLSRSAS
jgi:hypothetical protein